MSNSANQNIHSSFKFIIIIAQCFGFFPVQGVLSKDAHFLKFSWWSLRVIINFIIGCVAYICASAHLRRLFIGTFTLNDFGKKKTNFWYFQKKFFCKNVAFLLVFLQVELYSMVAMARTFFHFCFWRRSGPILSESLLN